VLEHVKYRLKPQVLDTALSFIVDCHPQVLRTSLEVECQDIFATPCLTLPHKEHAVPIETLLQHKLRGIHA
jgi:hypothetical protein